ncbi:hypothetical protein LK542_06640 [Massilia sp. IC2-477]|uniref:hypothetical protein n=1 Tax=Massilia sp. IC2-477 TaxID=2887198 RepID=UPI001D0F4BE2|nr:hypothetical protein [Massilia sp. IC2-477]MCC2955289.1 hypothetical protein [Massilia sp. IC2-477]
MNWHDLPIACFAVSTLISLWRRHWTDASWCPCVAAFLAFDKVPPAAIPWRLHYLLLVAGAALVVSQVLKEYREHRKSLAARPETGA